VLEPELIVADPARGGDVQADPLETLATALRATPVTQSVDPGHLLHFHAACARDPALAAIEVDEALLIEGLHDTPLAEVLVLAELLLALERFDLAVRVAEHAYTLHPMDHRVQDALFRARIYRRDGRVADAPGRELQGLHCSTLWNSMHFLASGHAHLCCSVWLRTPIGNVFRQPVEELWHSPAAEAMRDSARNGDYRYCGKMACPQIRWAMLGETPTAQDEDQQQAATSGEAWLPEPPPLPELPRSLNLSYDKTCNLSCPSCRSDRFTAKGAELSRIEAITDQVIPALGRAERLYVTGSGDPFASKSFRRVLMAINREACPDLRITLMTNGLLFTPREWEKFAHLHGMIDYVNVSVDAAEPETYRVVRRGGELQDLLPNLRFIGGLLADGAIANFRLCFVVQRRNYREMPAFMRMAAEVGASQVRFQMLHDWNAMPQEELHRQRIHVIGHPEHAEFLDVLRSIPTDAGPQILSDFGYLLGADPANT
jgi:MoaA/NifB/PqqE/SkfB family radical SAM enzyme